MKTMSQAGSEGSTSYRLLGNPTAGLVMGTWGFFIGFAAVALYGPAAKYFQDQMHLGGLALGLLVAAPQLTGSLLRIPFGAWVDRVGGRLPMLTLFCLSLVGMWGLVFILLTAKTLTVARLPDHRDVRLPERLRRRLVLGRHSAGVLLVSAVAPGHRARRLWRHRQSGAGPVHADPALRHRRLGARRLLFRLVHLPARRRRRSTRGWRATPISSSCASRASTRRQAREIARAKGQELFPNERSGRRSSPPPRIRAPGAWSRSISSPSAASWRSPPGSRPTGSTCTTWT